MMMTPERYAGAETFAAIMDRPKTNKALWDAIYARVVIPAEIVQRAEALGGRWNLLVLNEDWCGDSVNILPIIGRLAETARNLELRILGRDVNLDIMDAHLTGTSRSIPILVLYNATFNECGWWGPRPAALQRWVEEEGLAMSKPDRYREVRTWYARDRGITTMLEIVAMLEQCCARR